MWAILDWSECRVKPSNGHLLELLKQLETHYSFSFLLLICFSLLYFALFDDLVEPFLTGHSIISQLRGASLFPKSCQEDTRCWRVVFK
jgi:hypothetical protein